MAEQKKIVMPSASFIVARSHPDYIIGCENKLPWKLRTDLRMFKRLTENHVVIMGRKTLESIGKPLPNRINIVLSKKPPESNLDVQWVTTIEDAIFLADFYTICLGLEDFYVIGGDQIYKSFFEKDMYNRIYLTEVFCGKIDGDAYFPYELDRRKWKLISEIDYPATDYDQFPFRFVVWDKKSKTIRHRFKSEFLTDNHLLAHWKSEALKSIENWENLHPISVEVEEQQKFSFAV